MKTPLPLVVGLLLASLPGLRANPRPASDFVRDVAYSHVMVSPDGRRIGFLSPISQDKTDIVLVIVELATGKKSVIQAPLMPAGWGKDEINEIRNFIWLTNDRLAFMYRRADGRQFGVSAVGCDGSGFVDYPEMEDIFFADHHSEEFLALDTGSDGYMTHPVVNRVNAAPARTGYADMGRAAAVSLNQHLVADNNLGINEWVADRKGAVRIGVAFDGVATSVIYRQSDDAPWVRLHQFDSNGMGGYPFAIDWDGRTAYAGTLTSHGTWGISTFDLDGIKPSRLIASDPTYDIAPPNNVIELGTRLRFSLKKQRLVGISYQGAVPKVMWLDPEFAQIQASIDHSLPGMVNTLADWSDDETKFIIRSWSDRHPGTYYLLDRAAGKLKKLFDATPWLNASDLGRQLPISFKARDGLLIHGYITVPAGRAPKNLPIVVVPNPDLVYARRTWGYDGLAQYLASRGYAVLTVNPRGCPGYGKTFYEAGTRQAGRAVENDIADAVRWALARGLADPGRIAVAGEGYGGYSADCALENTPELYRCGISIECICDWMAYLKLDDNGPSFFKKGGFEANTTFYGYLKREVGDPATEAATLRDISPVNHADRVKAPILLISDKVWGTNLNDQTDLFADALKRTGGQLHLKIYPEIHGRDEMNKRTEDTFATIADFLDANMKPATVAR